MTAFSKPHARYQKDSGINKLSHHHDELQINMTEFSLFKVHQTVIIWVIYLMLYQNRFELLRKS